MHIVFSICCIQPTCSILNENNEVTLIVYNFPFKFNMNLCYEIWDCSFLIFAVTDGRGRFLFFLLSIGEGGN